jgi:hypothetical protein
MQDDGTQGDFLAGDHIYTRQVSLTPTAAPPRLYFRVSAALRGQLRRIQSAVVTLEVTPPGVPTLPAPSGLTAVVSDPASGTELLANEVIAIFQPTAHVQDIQAVVAAINGVLIGRIPALGVWQIQIASDGTSTPVLTAIERLKGSPS